MSLNHLRYLPLLGAPLLGFFVGCHHGSVQESPAPWNDYVLAAPSSEDELLQRFVESAATKTKLEREYMYNRLKEKPEVDSITTALAAYRNRRNAEAETALIRALELDFIFRPETSSLDLTSPELSEHFQTFEWHENDYPGNPLGPNEQFADVLGDVLDVVSPERRANRSRTAVVLRSEATPEVWDYILAQWVPIPGDENRLLNRHAMPSYVAMREAAAADGVAFEILSAHRDPERARQNAERAGNPNAVASFSAHSLGLAIDFALPRADGEGSYRLTTRPFSEVVEMRKSPTHKWLHLHAHKYGWYPFQLEPWHWEFNPLGFRDVFWAGFEGEVPSRE